jgi:hypothetical protein
MRVYRLEIEAKEPLLVAGPTVGNISAPERELLSGMTLRGAMLYRAFKERSPSLIEEMRDPKLIFHPAYPVSEYGISEPAHPFIYKCKLCKGEAAEDHLEKVKKNPLELKETIPPYHCERERHLFSMKSLGGKLVMKKEGTYVQFKGLEFVRMEAVGMSKRFRTSEVGMIYNYLCFAPGSRFQGRIVDLSEDRLHLLGYRENEEYELCIGRGGSRGMGHIALKFICEEEGFLKQLRGEIYQRLKETPYIFLRAKAPIYGLKALDDGFHVRSYLEIPSLKLEEEWITGTERISGFSLETGLPKAMIKAAKPGSLYLYRLPEEVGEELLETLVRISLTGLEPFNHLGLNLLEVV